MNPNNKHRLPYSHKPAQHIRELFLPPPLTFTTFSLPSFNLLEKSYTIQAIHHHNTFFTSKNRNPMSKPSLVIKTNQGNFYLETIDDSIAHNLFYMLVTVVLQCPVLKFLIVHHKSVKFRRLLFNIEKYFFKMKVLGQEVEEGVEKENLDLLKEQTKEMKNIRNINEFIRKTKDLGAKKINGIFTQKTEEISNLLKSLHTRFWILYKYKSVSARKSLDLNPKILRNYFNSHTSETKLSMLQLGSKLVIDFLMTKRNYFYEAALGNIVFSEEKGKDLFFTFRDSIGCLESWKDLKDKGVGFDKNRVIMFGSFLRNVMWVLDRVRKGEISAYDYKRDFGPMEFVHESFSR